MVTDLGDAEVVLGKLGARVVPVLNLVACALPVAALGVLLGGVDPVALVGAFAIASGVAVLGCSLALTLSVWVVKAHEVMTVVFAAWAAWLLAWPLARYAMGGWAPRWLEASNPFWLTLARYTVPGETSLAEPALFLSGCLVASAGLVALAVARLRPVYLGQLGRRPREIRIPRAIAWWRREVRWSRGPSLDANPVRWREWHRDRPTRWAQAVWAIYALISTVASLGLAAALYSGRPKGGVPSEITSLFNAFQGTFGLLLLAGSAASSLAEERVRGSLDVLLTTPLSTRSIVFGKWWGTFRRVPLLAIYPGLIAHALLPAVPEPGQVVLSYGVPILILAQGAAVSSLGLGLATWMARPGRAAAWTVAILVGSIVGWPGLAILADPSIRTANPGWADQVEVLIYYGSPLLNIGLTTELIPRLDFRGDQPAIVAMIAWSILYGVVALGFSLATFLTFERCLGRSPEHARSPLLSGSTSKVGAGELQWRPVAVAGHTDVIPP